MFDSQAKHPTLAVADPELVAPPVVELAVCDPLLMLAAHTDARAAVEVLGEASRAVAQAQGLALSMVAALAGMRRGEAVADAADRRARGLPIFCDPVRDAEDVERMIGDEVAAALRVSPSAGYAQVVLADTLVSGAPTAFAAVCQGRLDLARAVRIADGISVLRPEHAAAVERRLVPAAESMTPAQVTAAVRRAVIAADPAAADARHHAAVRARCARVRPEDDGMASLHVTGRADRISAAWQTATAVAEHRIRQQHKRDQRDGIDRAVSDRLTRDQARADAILDLMTHPDGLPDHNDATDGLPPVDVRVDLILPIGQLADTPSEMSGHGPIPPAFLAALLGGADPPDGTPGRGQRPANHSRTGRHRAHTFTRWLTNPAGIVTATGSTAYRPSPTLDRAIRARDTHCRFPGCMQPARNTDLDHTTPWPTGRTTTANLASLCRRHHRLKTHAPWHLEQHDHGTLTWTSPTGHRYTTRPPSWLTYGSHPPAQAAPPTTDADDPPF